MYPYLIGESSSTINISLREYNKLKGYELRKLDNETLHRAITSEYLLWAFSGAYFVEGEFDGPRFYIYSKEEIDSLIAKEYKKLESSFRIQNMKLSDLKLKLERAEALIKKLENKTFWEWLKSKFK